MFIKLASITFRAGFQSKDVILADSELGLSVFIIDLQWVYEYLSVVLTMVRYIQCCCFSGLDTSFSILK